MEGEEQRDPGMRIMKGREMGKGLVQDLGWQSRNLRGRGQVQGQGEAEAPGEDRKLREEGTGPRRRGGFLQSDPQQKIEKWTKGRMQGLRNSSELGWRMQEGRRGTGAGRKKEIPEEGGDASTHREDIDER